MSELLRGATPRYRSGSAIRALLGRLDHEFQAERDRWALWLPVAFGIGIAAYFALPEEPVAGTAPFVVVAAGAGLLAARRRPALLVAALGAAMAAAGFAVAQLRSDLVAAPTLVEEIGPVAVTGQVASLEVRQKAPRAVLHRITISGLDREATPARVRLRLVTAGSSALRPGDWIRVRAVVAPPPRPKMPGAFDFARQAYFERLGGVGFAVGQAEAIEPPDTFKPGIVDRLRADWDLWWGKLRDHVSERIVGHLPGDTGALAVALMAGDRSALSEPLVVAMRDSGLAHLLSISGLHMSLVTGILFFTLRAALALVPHLALRYPIKKWAACAALVGAFAYLNLSGATIPTQRAFVMVGLVLLAVLLDRTAISPRSVALAALAVLVLTPEALISASFQLSFAAVIGLVAGYETVAAEGWRVRRVGVVAQAGAYVAGTALTSVIATVATTPFVAYHFNRLAVFGLAANMLAVPITGIWIMPLALVAFALMPLGWEGPPLILMGAGLDLVIAVATWVAAWPAAVVTVSAMPQAGFALAVFGGLWLCLWRRPWRLLGAPLFAAAMATPLLVTPPDVLVTGSARLFAVHEPGTVLWVSSTRSERFAADLWLRRLGLGPAGERDWTPGDAMIGGRLLCDSLGCMYRRDSHRVALVLDPRALAEDCRMATLVISREPVRRRTCTHPDLVIDRFDLWREGAHALWLSGPAPRVETVADSQGRRPWSLRRGRDGAGGQ